MNETLLVVDPDVRAQRDLLTTLRARSYQTITASRFGEALHTLQMVRPDLLITVAELQGYSGLHLVVLGRAADPRLAALIVHDRIDEVLYREARLAGVTACLTRPLDPDQLLACIAEALATRERRFSRRTVLADNVIVGVGTGQVRLLDIGYGGFRFESQRVHRQVELMLELPVLELSLKAKRVWRRATPAGELWWCGAALVASADSETTKRWRRLVDTVRGGSSFAQ